MDVCRGNLTGIRGAVRVLEVGGKEGVSATGRGLIITSPNQASTSCATRKVSERRREGLVELFRTVIGLRSSSTSADSSKRVLRSDCWLRYWLLSY